MKHTPEAFDLAFQGNRLHLSLIGMSNVGKSRFSRMLVNEGVMDERIEIDALIASGLSEVCDSESETDALARWLGQPGDRGFAGREKWYLIQERASVREAIRYLENNSNKNIVIDTTGSLVHTGQPACDELKESNLMVYLQEDQEDVEAMIENFFAHPKPVIWGDYFSPDGQEDSDATQRRCYPNLLKARSARYKEIADVIVPTAELRKLNSSMDLIRAIRSRLTNNVTTSADEAL